MATAQALAAIGAPVVILARDASKADRVAGEIRAASGNDQVSVLPADLASLDSVRRAVDRFRADADRLHVLINNAGVSLNHRSVTADGFETTFAVNHLAPFLLTNLLMDLLQRSAPGRVVNVTSTAFRRARIDFDDLQGERNFNGIRAYSQSKLANVLFTSELARRLEGTGVTVNCVHPGVVRDTALGHGERFPAAHPGRLGGAAALHEEPRAGRPNIGVRGDLPGPRRRLRPFLHQQQAGTHQRDRPGHCPRPAAVDRQRATGRPHLTSTSPARRAAGYQPVAADLDREVPGLPIPPASEAAV
jgi:NAD(P)-dependent dehydrogenase (short-subunit alcohol dehydrogenase family)